MEQTTLQQRIEERAKKRLLKDLFDAANKEAEISFLIGTEYYPRKLNVISYYDTYATAGQKEKILIKDEFSQKVFDSLLPDYITQITDEILLKIDEIDYLVNSKQEQDL